MLVHAPPLVFIQDADARKQGSRKPVFINIKTVFIQDADARKQGVYLWIQTFS